MLTGEGVMYKVKYVNSTRLYQCSAPKHLASGQAVTSASVLFQYLATLHPYAKAW